jgi:CheY-like chemotaxis protein
MVDKLTQAKPAPRNAAPQKQYTILIADDQPDNLILLTRYLESEGYTYIKAKDGLETLEKVRDQLPDLVLLDVNMPHKDGFTVLEEIRTDPLTKDIPVIILTAARLDPVQVQFGLNLGADDYVTKPFDRRELLARIRTKLRAREIESGIRQQLTAVLQGTADAVLMFDAKARLSLVNPAAQSLFENYEANVGEELPCSAGYDSLRELIVRARTLGAPVSGKVVWPDTRVFAASVTPSQNDSCVIVLRDMTQFKNFD